MPLYSAFHRIYDSSTPIPENAVWLPIRGRNVLVRQHAGTLTLLSGTAAITAVLNPPTTLILGELDGILYVTCEAPDDFVLPEGWTAVDLRKLYAEIPEPQWSIAGYANHILHWERTSRHCPVCGSRINAMAQEWMRQCPNCGHMRYPPVSPAVLVLVHDGANRILLAHQPGWGAMHSILAGFVLPGESLEECAHREVEEEVGVKITDLQYKGSQPWPFPQQIMLGFTARYLSGEITIDAEELDQAAWFDATDLPMLPPPLSLSRQMIDAWLQERVQPTTTTLEPNENP